MKRSRSWQQPPDEAPAPSRPLPRKPWRPPAEEQPALILRPCPKALHRRDSLPSRASSPTFEGGVSACSLKNSHSSISSLPRFRMPSTSKPVTSSELAADKMSGLLDEWVKIIDYLGDSSTVFLARCPAIIEFLISKPSFSVLAR